MRFRNCCTVSLWRVGASSLTTRGPCSASPTTPAYVSATSLSEVGVTARSAHGIVADLVDTGYLAKQKTGRRNRYRIQEHLLLRDSVTRERTIGQMLDVLVGANPGSRGPTPGRVHDG